MFFNCLLKAKSRTEPAPQEFHTRARSLWLSRDHQNRPPDQLICVKRFLWVFSPTLVLSCLFISDSNSQNLFKQDTFTMIWGLDVRASFANVPVYSGSRQDFVLSQQRSSPMKRDLLERCWETTNSCDVFDCGCLVTRKYMLWVKRLKYRKIGDCCGIVVATEVVFFLTVSK